MISPRSFIVLLLAIGSVQAWMNGGPWFTGYGSQEMTALEVAQHHKHAVEEAYGAGNQTAIEELVNAHGLYLPLYNLPNLELVIARFRGYQEVYAFGKYEGHFYSMHLDRKDSSPTGFYMSRLIECEKNVC